ncbi:Rhodopsin, GQ-coupled [Camponotus japonicus]
MGPWAFGVPLVSTLGLLLNGYVLLVVLGLGKQTQQQQTANTLLLIHLGAVETAVCLILLIFTTGSWPVAGTWCVFHGFLLALLHPVALWTVTGLNCDRYYAIAAPLHYAALVSPRRVAVGLAASWTGALLLCLPPFSGLVPPYRYSPGLGCCAPDFGNGTWGSAAALYGAIYAIVGLGLPAVLVTVCNIRVLGIARYHRHRIASAIYEVTLSAQVTITHQRNPFFVPTVTAPSAGGPPRFHSAASTVMQLVGSLYLLYFPYCGFILWEACNAGNQHLLHAYPKLASLASFLLTCSPPVNGLLYGLKSQTLRRSVQNYWRKKATKSELQQEIQARTPSVAGSRRPSGSGNTSFFPFPPLQRRLSEALLALGSCRTGSNFESNNLGFQRGRLQPALSCNTLRVPTAESGTQIYAIYIADTVTELSR